MNISLHVREFYTAACMCMVVIVLIKSNIRLVTPNNIDAAKNNTEIKCHCKMKNKCMESVIQRQQPFVWTNNHKNETSDLI